MAAACWSSQPKIVPSNLVSESHFLRKAKLQTSCNKSVHNVLVRCVRTACLKLFEKDCNKLLTTSNKLVGQHSQKCQSLAASCGFYQPAASCQQVAASLLNSSSCSKSVKIRLVTTWYLKTCCKLLKQLASNLWTKSLDNQLAASLLTTCIIKSEQAMRTHPDIDLMTAR